MSDQINQIQATYDAIEDRILLKFKTLNEDIYLVWATRRFCKLLLPVLHGQHPHSGKALFDEDLEKTFEKQKALLEGNFSSPFEAPSTPHYPLGEEPILLAQISFKNMTTENASFLLEPNKGAGLVLPYHPQLLGPMLKIVTQAIEKAQWDLGSEISLQITDSHALVH